MQNMNAVRAQAKPDPDVVIPSVVKQASEDLDKQYYGKQEAPAPAEEAAAPPVTQEGNPAAPAPTPEQPAQPVVQPPQPTPTVDWEHRYNSMKGRYDSDTKKLADRISHLENLIATLQTVPKAAEKAPDPAPETKLITPEEENDYGSEFLKVVGKKAQEVLTPEVAQLRKQVSDLEARLQGQVQFVQQSAREKLMSALATEVPNWETLNTDERFLAWLRLPDTFSGAIRQTLLRNAFEQNETPRVIAFFKSFLAEEATVAPQPAAQPDPQPGVAKVPLESLAAPGRAQPAAGAPAEKPIITRSQISRFYTDVNTGKYAGRDKERLAHEAIIFAAQAEGRIVEG